VTVPPRALLERACAHRHGKAERDRPRTTAMPRPTIARRVATARPARSALAPGFRVKTCFSRRSYPCRRTSSPGLTERRAAGVLWFSTGCALAAAPGCAHEPDARLRSGTTPFRGPRPMPVGLRSRPESASLQRVTTRHKPAPMFAEYTMWWIGSYANPTLARAIVGVLIGVNVEKSFIFAE
jgi:hypothetical protein